ncbi:MAG: hypothetical protein GC201_15865 [Alphaproteobacteria bacterium]|nr:hypothetical protein [Alphaproteobacteria bacterium]
MALFAALCIYLFQKLSLLGWHNLIAAAPSNPWFYATLLAAYLVLPSFEALIYGRIWRVRLWRDFPVFMRKKVLNEAVLGYSGEAYLYFWARHALRLPDSEIFAAIRDNNLISATVSTGLAIILAGAVCLSGELDVILRGDATLARRMTIALMASALVLLLVLVLRRRFSALPPSLSRWLFMANGSRLLMTETLQLVQWSIALPFVPAWTWLALLAGQTLLTRVPFLPNKELTVLAFGVTLAGVLSTSGVQLSGMLMAAAAASQGLNALAFVATSLGWRRPSATDRPTSAPSRVEPAGGG